VLRALERILTQAGYTVARAADGNTAAREAMTGGYDVIVSDIHMSGVSGTELLAMLRAYGCGTPVILMTGSPSLDTAREAVELGALHYLTKPIERELLLRTVGRATARSRDVRRERMLQTATDPGQAAGFDRALGSLWMAFQPIVSLRMHGPFAYEALVRSHEPGFANPLPLLAFAEKHNRIHELSRGIRELCADAAANVPKGTLLFVNVHTQDLYDPELFSEQAPLSSYASRVVLEITERGALDEISDVGSRIRRLRDLGFMVAIDDLGAGYAGLSSIVMLEPDFVKLDMSLTRDLAASPLRKRLVASMVDACRDVGIKLVAEGVENERELLALRELGCDLLQGFHFARPQPEFVKVAA
jgi:EAL domain-containing protein (putative c-di-GMP-specific phosphodiesterase class I)/CheY-like chemotaxis protein